MPENISKISIKNSSGSGYDTREIGVKCQNVEVDYNKQGQVILDVNTETSVSTKSLTKVIQDVEKNSKGKAADNHAWSDADAGVDHGKASSTKYGHVKIGEGLYVNQDEGSPNKGATSVAFANDNEKADNKAVKANDSRLENPRKNPNELIFVNPENASGIGSRISYDGSRKLTIGVNEIGALPLNHKDEKATNYSLGHVRVVLDQGLDINESGYLKVKFGNTSGKVCEGNDARLSDNRTPKSHASALPFQYGGGNVQNYGHVKLLDDYLGATVNKNIQKAEFSVGASAYALIEAVNKIWYSNPNSFVEFRDITADFKSGVFSANISMYKPGNYIKIKMSNTNLTYVILLADYNYYKINSHAERASISQNHWIAFLIGIQDEWPMNNTNNGGNFKDSFMNERLFNTINPMIKELVGESHINKRDTILTDSTFNNNGYGWTWVSDCLSMLPTETQIAGTSIWSSTGSTIGVDYRQFALFRHVSPVEVFSKDFGQSYLNHEAEFMWLRTSTDNKSYPNLVGNYSALFTRQSVITSYSPEHHGIVYPYFCLN